MMATDLKLWRASIKVPNWLSLVAVLLLSHWAVGQNNNELLANLDDTSRIHQLCALGQQYQNSQPDIAKKYLDIAYQQAQQIGYTQGEAQATLQLGVIAIMQSDIETGKQLTKQALILFEQLNDTFGIGEAHKNLGIANYYLGNYAEAKVCYDRAIQQFQQTHSLVSIAKCYANLGMIHQQWGDYQKALDYFFQSLKIKEKTGSAEEIGRSYGTIALTYRSLGNLDAALTYYQKTLSLFEGSDDKYYLSATLNNVGMIYGEKEENARAIQYYQQAFEMATSINAWYFAVYSLNNLGYNYFKRGDHSRALPYFERAVTLGKNLKDKKIIPTVLENMALIHIKTREFAKARALLVEALSMAEQTQQKKDLRSLHDTYSQLYFESGNHQKALQHYKISRAYQDSLFNEEKSEQIAEMQTRFDVEKKEEKISAQEQKILLMAQTRKIEKQLRLVLLIALALVFLLFLFIYNRYRLKRKTAHLLHEKNQEIQAKNRQINQMNQELEKRMLRAQMDPHFIFNSLNSIQHFIAINDKTSAMKYLSKFSKLVRRVLESSINTQVPLADEIMLLKLYIELERLRYNHSLDYEIQVDESVNVYTTEIPFLLIQPYVENALKHGLRHKMEGGQLRIKIKQETHALICMVEDNGIGRKKAGENKHHNLFPSRGMSVTQKRLATLNHGQTEKTSVHILDLVDATGNPCGTRVNIFIPQTEEPCLLPLS